MANRKLFLFVILVLAVPGLAYVVYDYILTNRVELPIYYQTGNDAEGRAIFHEVPDFTFTNQMGNEVSLADLEGKILVVDFFFTYCPSICPIMTRNLQQVHEKYGLDDDVVILSYTVDPERDTPERLLEFATKYNANPDGWIFLTGEKSELYKLARKGYYLSATDGDGGPNDFIHSENVVLIDKNRWIRGYYDGTKKRQVEQLMMDIQKLKRQKA